MDDGPLTVVYNTTTVAGGGDRGNIMLKKATNCATVPPKGVSEGALMAQFSWRQLGRVQPPGPGRVRQAIQICETHPHRSHRIRRSGFLAAGRGALHLAGCGAPARTPTPATRAAATRRPRDPVLCHLAPKSYAETALLEKTTIGAGLKIVSVWTKSAEPGLELDHAVVQ